MMAGAVNSTETASESPSGEPPPSESLLASLRSSLSSADSDNKTRSLRAIASSFAEAHASTSAARFRAECALCALLDDPRRPLDAPARLAALFVLARGGEALGADDGEKRRSPGEADASPDAPDSPSPFAETLRFWASGDTSRTFRGDSPSTSHKHKHDANTLFDAERTFLLALSDPARRARVADAAPETWTRREDDRNPRVDETSDDERVREPKRASSLETLKAPPLGYWPSLKEGDETEPIGAPFVARAFDAERFWYAPKSHRDAEFSLNRPLWDKTAGLFRLDASFAARRDSARAILKESFKNPVAPMRQSTASAALRRDASLASVIARSADAFRETVEKNPPVAASVLLATARVPSARVARLNTLLDVLLENVGVHAMEVVAKAFEESREARNDARAVFQTDGNETTTRETREKLSAKFREVSSSYPLPSSFLTPFAARCVRRCVDGGEGGGGSGSRSHNASARLTCMFLQVLLRERHVSVADLPAEVESFCVEFMSVKEAADLFRLVKQLQREDARAANGEDAEGGAG